MSQPAFHLAASEECLGGSVHPACASRSCAVSRRSAMPPPPQKHCPDSKMSCLPQLGTCSPACFFTQWYTYLPPPFQSAIILPSTCRPAPLPVLVLDCCLAVALLDHHSIQQRRKQAQQAATKSRSSSSDSWQKGCSKTTSTSSKPTAAAAAGGDATAAAAELPTQPNVRLLQQPPKQGDDVETECAPTEAAASGEEHCAGSQLEGFAWQTICESWLFPVFLGGGGKLNVHLPKQLPRIKSIVLSVSLKDLHGKRYVSPGCFQFFLGGGGQTDCPLTKAAAAGQEYRPVCQFEGFAWQTVCESGIYRKGGGGHCIARMVFISRLWMWWVWGSGEGRG